MRKIVLVSVVFFALLCIGIPGIAQAFQTSDLEGTWYAHIKENNLAGASYWIYAILTVDAAGNITGGTYETPDGTVINVTGGTVVLDGDGLMTGSVAAEGGLTGTFPYGKMDPSKTIISFVGTDATGSLDLGVAIKKTGSFATSDLEGTWYAYIKENNMAGDAYWIYGILTVDAAGNITGGTYEIPDGTVINVTGGTVVLDGDGLMTGSVTAEGGLTGLFPYGKMDPSKTIISFVGTDVTGSLDLGVAIKKEAIAVIPANIVDSGGDGGSGGCFILDLLGD